MAVKRRQIFCRFVNAGAFLDEIVVFPVLVELRFPHDSASFDAPVILGNRERILFANFRNPDALDVLSIGNDEMWIGGGPEEVGVESGNIAVWRIVCRGVARVRQRSTTCHRTAVPE